MQPPAAPSSRATFTQSDGRLLPTLGTPPTHGVKINVRTRKEKQAIICFCHKFVHIKRRKKGKKRLQYEETEVKIPF